MDRPTQELEISGFGAALGAGTFSVTPVSVSGFFFFLFKTFHFEIIEDSKEFAK